MNTSLTREVTTATSLFDTLKNLQTRTIPLLSKGSVSGSSFWALTPLQGWNLAFPPMGRVTILQPLWSNASKGTSQVYLRWVQALFCARLLFYPFQEVAPWDSFPVICSRLGTSLLPWCASCPSIRFILSCLTRTSFSIRSLLAHICHIPCITVSCFIPCH